MLPRDDVKQAGSRRLASSSTTALGVAVRMRGSVAFVRVLLAVRKLRAQYAASSGSTSKEETRFDHLFRLLRGCCDRFDCCCDRLLAAHMQCAAAA